MIYPRFVTVLYPLIPTGEDPVRGTQFFKVDYEAEPRLVNVPETFDPNNRIDSGVKT